MCNKSLHVALYLNPHIPSVLADRQVVECCGGTGTLVPRSRHEHVVNMGRRGYARVSDLCQAPLSPISTFVFATTRMLTLAHLGSCREACAVPCASNRDVARDGRPYREQRPLLHARQPRIEPSYYTMVITV
jgi:hypothetical protein